MSAYRDWYVGMKVVCVAAPERIVGGSSMFPGSKYPSHNGIYTIREIRDDTPLGGSGIVVLLEELDNSHFAGRPGFRFEPGFTPTGFRPVQTRKTDISIFTAMLTDQRQKEPAQ